MTYVMWHIKVEDFDKWKAVFDSDPLERGANGSKGGLVLRNSKDANEAMILLEWDENQLGKLQSLVQSPKCKEVQEESGYTEPPAIYVLEVADKVAS